MLTRLQRTLLRATRTLWFRASLFSLIAVVTALVAKAVDRYVPEDNGLEIGAGAVEGILGVLASSLLAVTIFSLNTISSALSAATQHTSPRATRLLIEDYTAQNALATFLGAFMFSLVGIIALNVNYYGERGRLVLLLATIAVVAIVVVTLLRWIDHVAHLGRVGQTLARIEGATRDVLADRARRPWLGARALEGMHAPFGQPITATSVGYVQHIDVRGVQELAEAAGGRVQVLVLPGDFVDPATVLARVDGTWDEEARATLCRAITVEDERSFDQDPVHGITVLGEIASRALSPGLNDPGTAVDVIGRVVRLACGHAGPAVHESIAVDRVFVRPLDEGLLVRAAFEPMLRDGAGRIDVGLRLQAGLRSIASCGSVAMREAATELSRTALEAALPALPLETDRSRLREAAAWSISNGSLPPGIR